jgi:hypothetical protein
MSMSSLSATTSSSWYRGSGSRLDGQGRGLRSQGVLPPATARATMPAAADSSCGCCVARVPVSSPRTT